MHAPMTSPTPDVVNAYTALLEQAISILRMRLRYGDEVSVEEVHDYLDALHNIPIMLRRYGGWHVEANIKQDLQRYDEKWIGRTPSERRRSLIHTLDRALAGEFDTGE
jgi:hypothetical protein